MPYNLDKLINLSHNIDIDENVKEWRVDKMPDFNWFQFWLISFIIVYVVVMILDCR